MIRRLGFILVLFCFAPLAFAHFVFVIPQSDNTAQVVLSEDLKPDDDVDINLIAGAKLTIKGQSQPLKLLKSEQVLTVATPGHGTRVIQSTAELGVQKRGKGKPFFLIYHPKTIIGDAFDPATVLGDVPAEIVPIGKPGELKFKLLKNNKPAPGAEINVILPSGNSKKIVTDADGMTSAFEAPGRYGAWARCVDPAPGQANGEKYEEIRHYPTLVADLPAARFAPLPEAVSSFGAVASEGWLYVYGGHTAPTHHYSTAAVSARFHRINLAEGKTWEELPSGPPVQGMNLAAYKGKIYRAGGMQPRNKPEDKADNYSIADVACFDPAIGKWQSLPPLPTPRSSHDVAVVDGKLYVIGGWNMKGRTAGNDWLDTMQVLDLNSPDAQWQSIKQPFQRRALIAAANNGKIYAIGGFDDESDPRPEVDIYDIKNGTWSKGPNLPGKPQNGFSPAACTIDGKVYVSVGDGSMLRLNEGGDAWEKIASTTPRIVHRLIPNASQILVTGGASKGENLNLIEIVPK